MLLHGRCVFLHAYSDCGENCTSNMRFKITAGLAMIASFIALCCVVSGVQTTLLWVTGLVLAAGVVSSIRTTSE